MPPKLPPVATIGTNGKFLTAKCDAMPLKTTASQRPPEPIHVSARFRLTLESAILALEAGAARDERTFASLSDPDHRRRQQVLIAAQLERAFRLRELLAQTSLRPDNRAA
jgi:hypothetical protein